MIVKKCDYNDAYFNICYYFTVELSKFYLSNYARFQTSELQLN